MSSQNVPFNFDEMDESCKNAMNVQMDVNAIPNLDILLQEIQNLINDVETFNKCNTCQTSDTLCDKCKKKKNQHEVTLTHKYINELPIKIINLMFEDDRYNHLDQLLDMFDKLKEVKKGNVDINEQFAKFSEKLNETYVYPTHGGKDNFLKKMQNNKKA